MGARFDLAFKSISKGNLIPAKSVEAVASTISSQYEAVTTAVRDEL